MATPTLAPLETIETVEAFVARVAPKTFRGTRGEIKWPSDRIAQWLAGRTVFPPPSIVFRGQADAQWVPQPQGPLNEPPGHRE
jgi:hypothetical protein